MKFNKLRPVGHLSTSKEGKSHIPSIIRSELGLKGPGQIPFFLDANCVLLIRLGATLDDVLAGLDVLREDIKLRHEVETSHE